MLSVASSWWKQGDPAAALVERVAAGLLENAERREQQHRTGISGGKETKPEGRASSSMLPDVIMFHILGYLDARSLALSFRLERRVRHLGSDPSLSGRLWAPLLQAEFGACGHDSDNAGGILRSGARPPTGYVGYLRLALRRAEDELQHATAAQRVRRGVLAFARRAAQAHYATVAQSEDVPIPVQRGANGSVAMAASWTAMEDDNDVHNYQHSWQRQHQSRWPRLGWLRRILQANAPFSGEQMAHAAPANIPVRVRPHGVLSYTANMPARARPHGVLGAIADLCWCDDRDIALAISRRRRPAMLTIVTVDSMIVLRCRRDMSSYGTLHGPANFLPLDMAAEAAADATARLPRDDAGLPFMPPPTIPARNGSNESAAGGGVGGQAQRVVAPGFLGYAVELLKLRPEDESLRWTALFTVFKWLAVFETRAQADAVPRPSAEAVAAGTAPANNYNVALDDFDQQRAERARIRCRVAQQSAGDATGLGPGTAAGNTGGAGAGAQLGGQPTLKQDISNMPWPFIAYGKPRANPVDAVADGIGEDNAVGCNNDADALVQIALIERNKLRSSLAYALYGT